MTEQQLGFYSNGNDTVIAESIEQAIAIWEETTGERWTDYEDEDDWQLLDKSPDELIKVLWTDEFPRPEEVPTGGRIELGDYVGVCATAAQWIAHHGRGFFSSGEW